MALLPSMIGHFQVLSELGRGGMGIVYKVKDTRGGALAALKMIPPEALARADSALRFKREFRAMQRVEHPNVIRVFEAGTHEGCPFFTMELIEGRELRRWLDGDEPIVPTVKDAPPNALDAAQRARLNEPLRVQRVADSVVQVAYALAEIHSHRIVHRDLKPDNILVSKAGVVKLMDFGIAKQLSQQGEHSSGGMVVGTFKYLSPEQALGADVDGRADLYCLGIILYELLAGRHPFYSENSVGYAYHHARKPPPDIARFNPEVHQGLKAVCERLIKKDPGERYATAEDLIAAIREAMDGPASDLSARIKAAPKTKLPFELKKDQLFQPALTGRQAESRALTNAAVGLLAGSGAVVAITGPTGVGKTRLVREAQGRAKAKNVDFLWGKAERDGGLPYQPYVDILDQLVQQFQKRPADELIRLLGDDGRVLARYVPALSRIDSDARPRPAAPLEPQGERLRFLTSVTAFLGRCAAAQPRVLILDDLHHADELSLGLTRHLAETLAQGDPGDGGLGRAAPIVLVITLDPEDQSASEARALLSRLSQGRSFQSMALPPLDSDHVKEMVASMMGGGEVAAALAEYLHAETGGVPGLVEDRVRAWVEGGELRRRGRQWVFLKRDSAKPAARPTVSQAPAAAVGDGGLPGVPPTGPEGGLVVEVRNATRADIPLPDFEVDTHAQRVKRLSQVARDLAERIAVCGERVPSTLVERVALRAEDEVLDAIDELVKRSLLVEDAGAGDLRFVSADDRRALLSLLSPDRLQLLHMTAARAIEEDARRHKRPLNPEDLARHLLAGGDALRAFEQLMAAARLALAASATQTAADRVREAQDLLQREKEARPHDAALARCDVELVLLRLDVLGAVGEHKECITLASRRLPKMRGAVDARLVGETLLRLASSERVTGDLDGALSHVGEVLATTERGDAHALRCRAKSLCGQIYEHRGQFDLAERYYADALELARAIGDELEEERARSAVASRRLLSGDLAAAQRDFEQLLAHAEARGEKLRITGYVNALGVIAHERGRYDDAEVAYRRTIELAKPAGDRRAVAGGLNNIGVVRRDQGRSDDALALCAKASRILVEIEAVEHLAYVRIVEAQILLDRLDNAAAQKKAEEAFDLAEKAGSALKLAEAALCRGLSLARQSGGAEGRDDVRRGLEAANAVNANRVVLFGRLCEVELAALAGDKAGAAKRAADLARQAESTGFLRFVEKANALSQRLGL